MSGWGLMVGTDQERLEWARSSGSLVERQERMYVSAHHSIRSCDGLTNVQLQPSYYIFKMLK